MSIYCVALLGRKDEPTDAIEEYSRYLARALQAHDIQIEIIRMPWEIRGWPNALRPIPAAYRSASRSSGAEFQFALLNALLKALLHSDNVSQASQSRQNEQLSKGGIPRFARQIRDPFDYTVNGPPHIRQSG